MNDLEQRVARAICGALTFSEDGAESCGLVSGNGCVCRVTTENAALAALAALPLTPEQLEGLASGDMVVVPADEQYRKVRVRRVERQPFVIEEEQP